MDEMNIVSLDQIIEQHKNRKIVPLCLTADLCLGGGIPMGCTGIVAGPEKLGKTTVCLQYAANAQKLYDSEVYFFNIERRLTNKQLSQIQGLNKDKFYVVQPPAKLNKAGDVIGQEVWSSAVWLEYVGEIIQSKRHVIIIVDSLSKLASEKQQTENLDFQDRGASKKVETSFYQKYGELVVPNENILLFIAQGYKNTSGMGKATVIKVGSSIKYQADLILMGKYADKWDENSQTKRIEGHNMIYEVHESPLGPPHMTMEIPLRYGKGVDVIKDTITHGVNWGIIGKGGSWYTLPYAASEDDKGNEVLKYCETDKLDDFVKENKEWKVTKLQGEKQVYDWFNIHPEQAREIESTLRANLLGT